MSRRKRILLHTLFWLIIFIRQNVIALTASGISFNFQSFIFSKRTFITAGYFTISMFAFYGAYITLKKILVQKKIPAAICGLVLLFLALVTYRAVLEFVVFKMLFGYDNYAHNPSLSWKFFVPNVLFYYWDFIMYGFAWAAVLHWFNMEKLRREKENIDKTMQLKFLQSQINPHFLFNTINDIYALSLKKSDQAPAALMQLSGLLRYALYDNKELMVPLHKELAYIHNYLELQRTGYENLFYVDVETEGDLNAWQIPPMLLLPFVENACKHGITNDPLQPVKIVSIAGTKKLSFSVHNKKKMAEKDAEGGIGIDNIRKRLTLLYPGKHTLSIEQDVCNFSVMLMIENKEANYPSSTNTK